MHPRDPALVGTRLIAVYVCVQAIPGLASPGRVADRRRSHPAGACGDRRVADRRRAIDREPDLAAATRRHIAMKHPCHHAE